MQPGTIGWVDLTVENAESVRDFYAAVVGWKPEAVEMKGYSDFNMTAAGTPVAGICHARGSNAGLPAAWLLYFVVEDMDAAIAAVHAHGGALLRQPGPVGPMGRHAVIRDSAGAVCALFEVPK